jgi:hypothetical protein
MNIYDIGIEPGGVHTINVQADYIYFRSGSAGGGDTTVVFQPNAGGESVYLQPGQAYKMPAAMSGKNVTWTLRNLKGEGKIAGIILMGEGEFQDNRVSGSVEVIDGGKARTLAGMAFSIATAPGSAVTVNSRVAILNPAGSAKNLVVESIAFAPDALATANLYSGAGPIGIADPGFSKNMGMAAQISVAQVSRDVTTQTSGPGTAALWQMAAQAGARDVWTPTEPIVIPPGKSLIIWCNVKNVNFAALFEWFEESIV